MHTGYSQTLILRYFFVEVVVTWARMAGQKMLH